jgi:hypothetical protein
MLCHSVDLYHRDDFGAHIYNFPCWFVWLTKLGFLFYNKLGYVHDCKQGAKDNILT